MGIPSYFSYIIRNYPKIVKNLKFHKKNQQDFHHLFMDSNSIIYDAIKDIKPDEYNFEQLLIEKVIQNIENYIQQILNDKGISDCTCGLSKKLPYCDGSHKFISQIK